MSDVISFRADEDMAHEIAQEMENDPDDPSRSEATKRLVREAVDARQIPLWVRVGMSDRRAAQLESLRKQGESEDDLARKLFGEALEARDEDVLDAIGATGELREAVEGEREQGESLDEVVSRLLRRGVEADTDTPSLTERTAIGGVLIVFGLVFALAYHDGGAAIVVLLAILVMVYLAVYPSLDAAAGRVVSAVRPTRGKNNRK